MSVEIMSVTLELTPERDSDNSHGPPNAQVSFTPGGICLRLSSPPREIWLSAAHLSAIVALYSLTEKAP